MTHEQPLDALRVMSLVTDAAEHFWLGVDPAQGARQLLAQRRPTTRELAAARRENHDIHGGGTPDVLRERGFRASPPPPDVLRLRRAVDEELHIAATLLDPAT